jgi:hypothetical protein
MGGIESLFEGRDGWRMLVGLFYMILEYWVFLIIFVEDRVWIWEKYEDLSENYIYHICRLISDG